MQVAQTFNYRGLRMKYTTPNQGTVSAKELAAHLPEHAAVSLAAADFAAADTAKKSVASFDTIAKLVDTSRERLAAAVTTNAINHFQTANPDKEEGFTVNVEFSAYGEHKGRVHIDQGGNVVTSIAAKVGDLMAAAVERGEALRKQYSSE